MNFFAAFKRENKKMQSGDVEWVRRKRAALAYAENGMHEAAADEFAKAAVASFSVRSESIQNYLLAARSYAKAGKDYEAVTHYRAASMINLMSTSFSHLIAAEILEESAIFQEKIGHSAADAFKSAAEEYALAGYPDKSVACKKRELALRNK